MNNKNQLRNFLNYCCIVFAVLILISTIVLCMDSIDNKGILPIIFFLLLCFNTAYYFSMLPFDYFKRNIKYKFKLRPYYIIEFLKYVIIIFMMYFTALVYWS